MLQAENVDLHYGAAQALRGVSLSAIPGKITGLSGLDAPAQVVLVAHALGVRPAVAGDDWNSNCTGAETGFPPVPNQAITNASAYCAARYHHSGGSIYALADGHAKWVKGPPNSWLDRSATGIAWLKPLTPNASAWFREN